MLRVFRRCCDGAENLGQRIGPTKSVINRFLAFRVDHELKQLATNGATYCVYSSGSRMGCQMGLQLARGGRRIDHRNVLSRFHRLHPSRRSKIHNLFSFFISSTLHTPSKPHSRTSPKTSFLTFHPWNPSITSTSSHRPAGSASRFSAIT